MSPYWEVFKKLFTAFLFVAGEPQWEYHEIKGSRSTFDSRKMFFKPEDTFHGIELELLYDPEKPRMYASIFSLTFPQDPRHPKKAKLNVSAENEQYIIIADCLEGGQKVLLPPSGANLIIEKLSRSQTVRISAGRYTSEITPSGFAEAYRSLAQKPVDQ